MNNQLLSQIFELLKGKKTHAVAALAIVYIVFCQINHLETDKQIMYLFEFLGLSALRAGLNGSQKSE